MALTLNYVLARPPGYASRSLLAELCEWKDV